MVQARNERSFFYPDPPLAVKQRIRNVRGFYKEITGKPDQPDRRVLSESEPGAYGRVIPIRICKSPKTNSAMAEAALSRRAAAVLLRLAIAKMTVRPASPPISVR